MVVWQDILTAPQDESDVLVYCSSTNEMFVARKYGDDAPDEWHYAAIREIGARVCCIPSHWAPLPEPPLIEEGEEEAAEARGKSAFVTGEGV